MRSDATIHVVDDDAQARQALEALARSMNVAIRSYASAEEFLSDYKGERPGCLLTDVRMQGLSGIDLQDRLRERGSSLAVIVISAYADVPTAVHAMQHGAATFLTKPVPPDTLWDAIESALQRDTEVYEHERQLTEIRQRIDSLTDAERQVMDMVVDGVANKVIAKRMEVSLRTVEARRHQVFAKMNVQSVAELVRCVMKVRGEQMDC
ncbi:MAG: response regulator [Pirellulaceae bacterium]|nr:response regulator transcription factor [Planctomycetales bacterium]